MVECWYKTDIRWYEECNIIHQDQLYLFFDEIPSIQDNAMEYVYNLMMI